MAGSKPAPLHCAGWERAPRLRSMVRQGGFVTGRLAGATGNWLYLQFKRRYSVGVEDRAAATFSVVLGPMAEDGQGGWAISQRRPGHA